MTIVFQGEQRLAQAGDAQARLLAAIAPGATVAIDVAGITHADLSFIQIIEATRRQAGQCGAQITLVVADNAAIPACLTDLLAEAGIAPSPFWTCGALPS